MGEGRGEQRSRGREWEGKGREQGRENGVQKDREGKERHLFETFILFS